MIKSDYDFIFIDCPPSLGLITINCLSASDSIIVPIQCEYFALEGLGKLMSTIRQIQSHHNNELGIEGLLLTMYDSRLRLSNNVIEEVKMHFGNIVFDTIIQRNVRLSEASGHGTSIIKYDANCRGAINYLNLAKEFINKNLNKIQTQMDSKNRLGRGLASIFNTQTKLNNITELSLDVITRNPYQPRSNFSNNEIKELASSIKTYGLIQPITVGNQIRINMN